MQLTTILVKLMFDGLNDTYQSYSHKHLYKNKRLCDNQWCTELTERKYICLLLCKIEHLSKQIVWNLKKKNGQDPLAWLTVLLTPCGWAMPTLPSPDAKRVYHSMNLSYWSQVWFNSLRPSHAIYANMAQSTQARVMACCLMAPEPMLIYHQWGLVAFTSIP